MKLEDFHLLDNEPLDNSIIERELQKYIIDKEIS